MIKFEGTISGAAFRRYYISMIGTGHQLFLVVFPVYFFLSYRISVDVFGDLSFFRDMLLIYPLCPVMMFFKGKKERKRITPILVEVNHDYVVSTTVKDEYRRPIRKVQKVIDQGDFYELKFGWLLNGGFMKESFICQKDLLTEGSLNEFESLFEGKIERKKETEFTGGK